VRLFTIPVRTATPSKSQVEISIRGEGYDTPSVTVIATVPYRVIASLVCIICVWFEFQIQTPSLISNQVF
jgi:hypothetical protein